MENISVSLAKNENQKPFRQGLGLSSPETLLFLESAVLQMAKSFIEKDAPYLDFNNVFVHFHTNEHQALMKVDFAVYGIIDLDAFGKVFSRFGALKKTTAEFVIYEEAQTVSSSNRTAPAQFSPILIMMIDDDELREAGVKNPELYRSQVIETIKTNYSFMLSRLEQKAFDMINIKIN